MRKLTVVFTLAILLTPLIATAQEDDPNQYASLDQLGTVIDAFVSGEGLEGVIFHADEGAESAIVRQFQVTTNLVSGRTRGKADMEFVPVGFSEGSTTTLDNLEKQFDGTIGEFGGIIPPLAPGSRVDDEIDVSALFEGWTAYGDRGLIEGPIIINPSVQTIWGIELTGDGTCSERRYFGRSWISEGVGNAPDPLFTAQGLAGSYNDDSHEALAGTGGRLIEFFCTPQGSIAWAQRMKDDGRVRPFGPTGVIALVKDQFVVFFNRVDELDGRLEQIFYASPPDGGPVVVSQVESEDLLLVPNPYSTYKTRVDVLPVEPATEGGTARLLVYDGDGADSVLIQSPEAACIPTDSVYFFLSGIADAAAAKFWVRDGSKFAAIVMKEGDADTLEMIIPYPNHDERLSINTQTGEATLETPRCTSPVSVLVDGEPLGGGADTDDTEDEEQTSDDESTTEAGGDETTTAGEDDGIPWGPIGIALVLVAAVTAYTVNRNRKKKDCKPEEEALDSAINASKLAHDAFEPKQAALHEAIMNDGPKDVVDRARAERDEAQAAADLAMDTYRRARAAYQACKGGADTGDDLDPIGVGAGTTRTRADAPEPQPEAEPERGGTPIPPAVPGTLNEPDDTDLEGCEGQPDEVRPDPGLQSHMFTIPVGGVVIRSSMSSWTRAMGGERGLSPQAFQDLDESDLDAALADFDKQSKVVRIHPQITVKTVTVECGYVWTCQNNKWIKTDEIQHLKTTETATDTWKIGDRTDSPSKETAKKHVESAQEKMNLLEELDEYDDFECG